MIGGPRLWRAELPCALKKAQAMSGHSTSNTSCLSGVPNRDDCGGVEPYFRLEKGCSHKGTCGFDITREIARIARRAKRAVVREIENGPFEFDLLVIKDALHSLQAASELQRKRKSVRSGRRPGTDGSTADSVADRRVLAPYINDAIKVLKLRARCELDAEMQAAPVLVFAGHRIPWKDFYFEYPDYFGVAYNMNPPMHVRALGRGGGRTTRS